VQCAVDPAVAGAGEPVCRFCSPEEASSGAVPFHEANLSRSANRWLSPTSTISRAAPDGPIPVRSMSVEPRTWIRSRSSS
jgi:hypothetical protein